MSSSCSGCCTDEGTSHAADAALTRNTGPLCDPVSKCGPGRIRTYVGNAGRFTVCSLWPLGHRPYVVKTHCDWIRDSSIRSRRPVTGVRTIVSVGRTAHHIALLAHLPDVLGLQRRSRRSEAAEGSSDGSETLGVPRPPRRRVQMATAVVHDLLLPSRRIR